MNFDPSKLKIAPLEESNLAEVIQIAEILERTPHWSTDSYLQLVSKNPSVGRVALIATYTSEVVAYVIACPIPPEAELESIGVVGTFQRQGVGRRLIDALMRQLVPSGVETLLLEVRASNLPALAFYGSIGFVQTGLRLRYYADPVEDAVQMQLRFDSGLP